jgi:hypothetical protein
MPLFKGRLLQVSITPGSFAFGVSFLNESGEQQGVYMKMPEHTFGTWLCDGRPVRDTQQLVTFLVWPSVIDVEIERYADAGTVDIVRLVRSASVET